MDNTLIIWNRPQSNEIRIYVNSDFFQEKWEKIWITKATDGGLKIDCKLWSDTVYKIKSKSLLASECLNCDFATQARFAAKSFVLNILKEQALSINSFDKLVAKIELKKEA